MANRRFTIFEWMGMHLHILGHATWEAAPTKSNQIKLLQKAEADVI